MKDKTKGKICLFLDMQLFGLHFTKFEVGFHTGHKFRALLSY